MKVVVCGSYGDFNTFVELLDYTRKHFETEQVFPDQAHLDEAQPSIMAHHVTNVETAETVDVRSKLMMHYFQAIDKADVVIVMNEKNGREYYGTGTMLELGYALAKSKIIYLTRHPTNPNIMSLLKIFPNNSAVSILPANR